MYSYLAVALLSYFRLKGVSRCHLTKKQFPFQHFHATTNHTTSRVKKFTNKLCFRKTQPKKPYWCLDSKMLQKKSFTIVIIVNELQLYKTYIVSAVASGAGLNDKSPTRGAFRPDFWSAFFLRNETDYTFKTTSYSFQLPMFCRPIYYLRGAYSRMIRALFFIA